MHRAGGLGAVADVDHDGPALPRHHGRPLEDHAAPFGHQGVRGGVRLLLHRQRLAGQGGLVHLQAVLPQEPGVGGHHVVPLEVDHMPRPEPARLHGAGAAGRGLFLGRDQARLLLLLRDQPGQRPLGPQPLDAAHQGVQVEGADDEQRVHDGAEDRRRRRADRQHRGERIMEFAADGPAEPVGPACGGDGRVPGDAPGRLAQPGGQRVERSGLGRRFVFEPLPGLVRVQLVPVDAGAGVRGAGHRHAYRGPDAGQQRRRGAGVDRGVPEAGQHGPAAGSAAGLADGDEQPGQRGTGAGQRLGAAADRAGSRDGGQDPPHVGQAVQGEDVGAPVDGAVPVGQGDRDVGGAQCGRHVVAVGLLYPGDHQHGPLAAARLVHDVVQRSAGVDDLVGETGEVLQGRVVHEDDPQPGTAGRVEHRLGPRVGLAVLGAQGAGVQDDRPGHLQLAQPLRGRGPARPCGPGRR
ncbi:hypothetical protein GCM10017687_67410 [Streptomyces echinatus]